MKSIGEIVLLSKELYGEMAKMQFRDYRAEDDEVQNAYAKLYAALRIFCESNKSD